MRTAIAFVALILLAAWTLTNAKAQDGNIGDFGVGHEQWHHWYQTGEDGGPLMRPHQPGVRCCDGDCRPTLARFRDGQWFALIDGQYDPVPESRVKLNVTTPNGMAHVCAPRRYSP